MAQERRGSRWRAGAPPRAPTGSSPWLAAQREGATQPRSLNTFLSEVAGHQPW